MVTCKIISELEDDSFQPNHMHIQMEGDKLNHTIINVLRRTLLEDVPSLAFDKEYISIEKNTSVYNNDFMRNRIENMPIVNMSNGELNFDEYDNLKYKHINNSDEEPKLSIFCKKKNETSNILNVTTDDITFYDGNTKIDNIYKNRILIVKLKPGEEIEFSAKSKLGLGKSNAIYSSVGICCYEILNDNKFILKFETSGQYSNRYLLKNVCKIILHRLDVIKDKMKDLKFNDDSNSGKFIIDNEDHTLGSLIAYGLQDHKNIEIAGFMLDNLLLKNLEISYLTNSGKPINSIVIDVIDIYIKKFNLINKIFENI